MPVPDDVEPVALKRLLTDMTAVDASARPALTAVHHRLLAIHRTLVAEGAENCFIAPAGHISPRFLPAISATEPTPAATAQAPGTSVETMQGTPAGAAARALHCIAVQWHLHAQSSKS